MRFTLEMPVWGATAAPDAVRAIATAAEHAGLSAVGYTDHPAPSRKWLTTGGHASYDPFAALAFTAACTSSIRLMTYLAVLPYRNPLLMMKSMATVDRLSGGRLTMVVGSGYLRSEFRALGQPFEDRNTLVDEALDALGALDEHGGVICSGRDFDAHDQVIDPAPVQTPHPPVWIGGSSRRSLERVVEHGAGWAPLMTSPEFASVVRTRPMATIDDVAARVRRLHEMLRAAGRDPARVAVQLDGMSDMVGALDRPDQHDELLARLADAGVTQLVLRPPRPASPEEVVDLLTDYGARFAATERS